MRRDDTEKKYFFRSPERIFLLNGAWYFATREGEEGPFSSEVQAQMEVERFVSAKTELARFQSERERLRSSRRVQSPMRVDQPTQQCTGERSEVHIDERAIAPSPAPLPSRDLPRTWTSARLRSKRKVHI